MAFRTSSIAALSPTRSELESVCTGVRSRSSSTYTSGAHAAAAAAAEGHRPLRVLTSFDSPSNRQCANKAAEIPHRHGALDSICACFRFDSHAGVERTARDCGGHDTSSSEQPRLSAEATEDSNAERVDMFTDGDRSARESLRLIFELMRERQQIPQTIKVVDGVGGAELRHGLANTIRRPLAFRRASVRSTRCFSKGGSERGDSAQVSRRQHVRVPSVVRSTRPSIECEPQLDGTQRQVRRSRRRQAGMNVALRATRGRRPEPGRHLPICEQAIRLPDCNPPAGRARSTARQASVTLFPAKCSLATRHQYLADTSTSPARCKRLEQRPRLCVLLQPKERSRQGDTSRYCEVRVVQCRCR